MADVVQFFAPRVAGITSRAETELGPGEVRLRTLFSGISAGTELTAYRGSNPYLARRWDEEVRLFRDEAPSLEYPMDAWGYEEVGIVTEVGSAEDGDLAGLRVWGGWGHATETVMTAVRARARMISGKDTVLGIFAKIGAIALNAVLDADIHVGETVAVFGLGVPGQIVAQLARLNGARVIAVDTIESRRDLALRLGADVVLDPADAPPAEVIRTLTSRRGADVAIEIAGSYRALHEAIRSVAYGSRVVAAGFMQGDGVGLRLGEELHHNRVSIVSSQISGVNPQLQHRWDEHRLSRTVMDLAADGRLDLRPLISHTIPFRDAAEAYKLLDQRPGEAMQVVLQFDGSDA